MSNRSTEIKRVTGETDIQLMLNLDGTGRSKINTGIGFLDHMFTALTKHSRFDMDLNCKGDLVVDDHHTAEDCALTIGQALDQCLGDRKGIQRFGYAYAPLDEALARAVVDFSGRPFSAVNLGFKRDMVGTIACENLTHVFQSLAMTSRMTLHVEVIAGDNDHHKAEAGFKALALALRQAVTRTGFNDVPSTKGVL